MSEPGHPETTVALIESIQNISPEEFVSYHLLDRIPWIFESRREYINWKSVLASELKVDPFSLLIVGSACLGFSLTPRKNFSPFAIHSDIDVAVVSSRHFDEAWRWLRDLSPEETIIKGSFDADMFRWHRRNLIFDGTIATERLLGRLPFGPTWATALGNASSREPTVGRQINVRIYRDFEALRSYQTKSAREAKKRILSSSTI